jgi:hypothetical protein
VRRLQENGRLQIAIDALEHAGATRIELGLKLWQSGQPIGVNVQCLICGRGPLEHGEPAGHMLLVVHEWSLRFTSAVGATMTVRRGSLDALAGWLEAWLQRHAHEGT